MANIKKYIHFSVFFWVKLFYTVSGYTIKEMYLNAWNILLCVTKEYTKVVIWEVHICVHIKYISRMMYVIHVLLFWFSAGQFYIDGLRPGMGVQIWKKLIMEADFWYFTWWKASRK